MKINSTLSEVLTCNTGAPQGCVSSSLLFTLYTNDCQSMNSSRNSVIKFSDDTVILSLLSKDMDLNIYKSEVDQVVQWCDNHKLVLNVTKTKEMIFDPRGVGNHSSVTVKGQDIEQVMSYKYLGILLDPQFQWSAQVGSVCTRISQRLHFLRRLRVHGVAKSVMLLFFRTCIESVLRYGITSWCGNLSVKLKTQINNLLKRAGKIMGTPPPLSLQEVLEETMIKQSRRIANDPTHVLSNQYELLPSGRRYRVPQCKRNRYKYSFIPLSISLLNKAKAK